jgi:hypothetical protein
VDENHAASQPQHETNLYVEGLYADLSRDGVGASTVRHAADMLGVALSHACKLKLIPSNPASAVAKPKEPAREMLFLTPDQVKVLLDAAVSQQCYPLVVLARRQGAVKGSYLCSPGETLTCSRGR